jgi:hypothetical protein
MPVYALYVPTGRRPVSGIGMEKFASRELTGRVLRERNATGRSRAFYVGAPTPKGFSDRPVREFPLADETGYMRVFLRYARDPVPGLLDRPDEEWIVVEGGAQGVVVRMPWSDGDGSEALDGVDRVHVVPGGARFKSVDYEVRTPTTVKPVAEPCPSCFLVPSVTHRCNCS